MGSRSILVGLSLVLMLFSIRLGYAHDDGKCFITKLSAISFLLLFEFCNISLVWLAAFTRPKCENAFCFDVDCVRT